MPSYDSIVVGEDWISEHYFTTDSTKESFQGKVLEQRKQWDAEAAEGRDTVRRHLLAAAGELQTALSTLDEHPEGAAYAHALTRRTLGFAEELTDYLGERAGTQLRLPAAQLDGISSTLFLQAAPVTSVDDILDPQTGLLLEPGEEDNKPITAVSKAVSAAFRVDEPPAFVVVQAGQWLLLAEAERWAEGRYLAVDLLVVAERRDDKRGGEIDRVVAMLSRQALLPDADGNIWWTGVLEDSVKHTVGVSKDLREGIRLSIEIIANDVVRRRAERGLPLEQIDAQQLAKQSLRFLYRILFLLYAEASPEMKVLPSGAPEYGEGYGLDRLRELTLMELVSPQAKSGTHLYESLATLFRLVDQGHATNGPTRDDVDDPAPGLEFNALRADLFAPAATGLINEIGLSNEATQRVLQHLLLSKESKGRKGADRGFISYAELGINQLGAVYEGLMSYTGFFATEDLYEVAEGGDTEKGSWVVPVSQADYLSESNFVTRIDEVTGETVPVVHAEGAFVFRLAGRERQQSASYYTPEVLTRFVVSQALEELLDQNGERTTPEQILQLSICEPALGSGAFAIEAVRQLADEYLKRKQEDLGEIIDADQYQVELQKVKAYLALHQVYGVDLNATAVELAEISLWLDTMVAGLKAPWFGLHLRRGNSLIGARRAVYSPTLLAKKAWLSAPPEDKPLGEEIGAGIHHFLLPAQGWGAVTDTVEAKAYSPEKREALRLWRNSIRSSPSATMKRRLAALAERVETLWELALRRLAIAESEIRREIEVWGQPEGERSATAVTREQIESALGDELGAYRRLRRVMDAWCALCCWPLTTAIKPPGWEDWVGGLEAILGVPPRSGKFEKYGQTSFASDLSWQELDLAEANDRVFSQARAVDDALKRFPWLEVVQDIANAQAFFHWELDFAPVFERSGFDLQVGNPPWVRPDWDEVRELAEFDPWWVVTDAPSPSRQKERRENLLADPNVVARLLDQRAGQAGISELYGSPTLYPLLQGQHSNLYRSFISNTWRNMKVDGIVALIHTDNHLTEPSAGKIRRECYLRLRRHWDFKNQLKLFEIGNTRSFSVNVYGARNDSPHFLHAAYLYHPDTILRSFKHNGDTPLPGIKDENDNWSLEPHSSRIETVDVSVLRQWADLLDSVDLPSLEARMVYTPTRAANAAIAQLSKAPRVPVSDLMLTQGWVEKTGFDLGFYRKRPERPKRFDHLIYQGPQIWIANAFFQETNEAAKTHRDYDVINTEGIGSQFIPRTRYQVAKPWPEYLAGYPQWAGRPSNDYYRVAWRRRLDTNMERTVISCLLPPGPCHVHQMVTAHLNDNRTTAVLSGFLSSLTVDFLIRTANFGDLVMGVLGVVPFLRDSPLHEHLLHRVLLLNCLTANFAELWEEVFSPAWRNDGWVAGVGGALRPHTELDAVESVWTESTPLRRQADRRRAAIEIDAIVDVALGLSVEQSLAIYRAQFPVLQRYEREALYDVNGRQLPGRLASDYRKGKLKAADCTMDGVTYVEPFVGVDRERDIKLAHKHFSDLAQD